MLKHALALFIFLCIALCGGRVTYAQDDAVIDAAKKEGQVFFYTGKNLPTMQDVAHGFEAKYPFLKQTEFFIF